MITSWTNNINIVAGNIRERIKKYRKGIRQAAKSVSKWYIKTWIIDRFLSGRPGLRKVSGKAQKSWNSKISVSQHSGVFVQMYSSMKDREFNYLKAHQDPQTRHSAFGKPSKPWRLKKRLFIFEDWGNSENYGQGGRVFARDLKRSWARYA